MVYSIIATAFLAAVQPNPTVSSPVSEVLADTNRQRAEMERVQSRRGRSGDLDRLRSAVLSAAPTVDITQEGLTEADRDTLREVQFDRIANLLATAGYNTGIINSLRARGADLIEAAAAVVNGRPTVEQKAMLSDAVLIGDIVRVDLGAAAEDNFGSTVHIHVRDSLRGPAQIGSTIFLRQVSGQTAQGGLTLNSVDELLVEGRSFLLFLSREAYEANAIRRGGRPRGSAIGTSSDFTAFQLFLPYRIEDNNLHATAPGQFDEPNASAVLARIRALPNHTTQRR